MKPFHWQKLALGTLTMLLVQGAFTAAEARKGYLTRMQKRGSVTRAKVPEVTDVVPMGQLVLPLNELSAGEVRQLLESAYGKENGIEVTRPSLKRGPQQPVERRTLRRCEMRSSGK